MTQKSWPWSTVAALGDGAAELNEADSRAFLAIWFGVQNPAVEGVSKGVGGELAVSGTASPLAVASGSGICYGLYINDAATTTPAISTPAVGTTGGRVVLQTNWAGTGGGSLEARTRIAVKKSADGVAAIPGLTQVFGTTWEISLATFQITTGGAITVTDDRTFRRSTMVMGASEIDNDSVGNAELRNSAAVSVIGRSANSTGDPADIAAGANDRLLARVGDVLGFVQLTLGMIPDLLITTAKLADAAVSFVKLGPGAAVSVWGRSANSSGTINNIQAGANDRLLARVADALSFVQLTLGMIPDLLLTTAKLADLAVTTAKLANDSVDDTKAGNRVPQFYRRQGASATDWSAAGNTTQTPTSVRMQAGAKVGSANPTAVTFPVAFSNKPLVFLQPIGASALMAMATNVTAAGFDLYLFDDAGGDSAADCNWQAIGPE